MPESVRAPPRAEESGGYHRSPCPHQREQGSGRRYHEKLAAAESKSKADTEKWTTERQRLKDVFARSQQKELQAKKVSERDAANEAINQVCTEEEEFKQWTNRKRSYYPTNSGNRLFSRSAAEELTPVQDERASGRTFRCHLSQERPSTTRLQTSTRMTLGQQ